MYADKTQYTGQLVIGTVEVGYTQFIFQDTIRILLYTIQDTIRILLYTIQDTIRILLYTIQDTIRILLYTIQDTIRILLYTIQDTISELKNIFAEAILYRNKLHSYTVAQLHTHKPKKID